MDNTVRKAHNSLSDDELVTRCKSKKMIYCGRGKMDGETSIDFLCPRHQRFGIQHRKAYDFSRLKVICEYCNHTKLKDIFKEEVESINPTVKILSEYVDWNTNVQYLCLICNQIRYGLPSVLLYGGGCKNCAHIKRWDSRGRVTTEDYINKLTNAGTNDNVEIIGEYTGSHNYISCRCKIHNVEWESFACNILNGSATCPECALENIRIAEAFSTEQFKERLNEILPHIKLHGEYVNCNTTTTFYCEIHDMYFDAKPRTLLYGKTTGCPYCSETLGERRMREILVDKLSMNIQTQYSFPDCKYKNKLKFDACDLDNMILFEYQGQQHYYPVDFAGKGEEWAKEQFEINKTRDKIKDDYCKENNIPLIKIPYWEYDMMDSYIINELKKIA